MDMEWVVHRAIGLHFVDEPDFDSFTNAECPGDCTILGAGLAFDQLPDHIDGIRRTVDLGHQVFPLETITRCVGACEEPCCATAEWEGTSFIPKIGHVAASVEVT